ncbi:tetratricopeptide repeat protein [Bernardetia sp. MNP-M8]|uniref:tetratricopeptide repeat protein n=1 Tax=Bernardetia sp. MNP-M8 TaxID=3127470 RepID=UPI0030CE41CF
MKLYEIVVILLFVIAIILQFFNIGEDTILIILLSTNTLLALSYFIGGYWFFKRKQNDEEENENENENKAISIFAGFAFGIALICFWTRIIVTPNEVISYLPFANIVFFVILLILLIVKRNDSIFTKNNKPILIRSFIILIITCFFFYIPIEFEPYNDLIRSMNASSERMQHNLNMAKYHGKSQKESANTNYEKAVEYSLLSEIEGRRGFKLSDSDLFLDNGEVDTTLLKELDLRRMNAIYSELYAVYTRLGHYNLQNGKGEEALKNYKIAHQILYIYNLNDGRWEQQNVVSFANIGKAFSHLNQFEEANTQFNKSLYLIDSADYKDNIEPQKIATAYSEIAKSLSKRGLYEPSTNYYTSAIEIMVKDSLNEEFREYLATTYMEIGKNYTQLSNPIKAIDNYEKVFFYTEDKSEDPSLRSFVYTGLAYLQLHNYEKAESIFLECIKLYKNLGEEGVTNIGVIKVFLARTYIQLNKYQEAEKLLQEGIEITKVEEGKMSSNYLVGLSVYANLNSILSNYKEAEKQYQEAFEISENQSQTSIRTLELLIQVANNKVSLSKLEIAKDYTDEITKKIPEANGESLNTSNNVVADVAYLNYSVGNYEDAKLYYEMIININKRNNNTKDISMGVAFNGLGLLEINDKKYIKADSLFHQSLEIHNAIFKTSNPSLATLHLNMAKLYILKKEYQKVKTNLAICLKMNQDLFDKSHTNFADIYFAYGDLAKEQNEKEKAKEHYQKALKIYSAKFDEEHFKIKSVKEQIKSIQF